MFNFLFLNCYRKRYSHWTQFDLALDHMQWMKPRSNVIHINNKAQQTQHPESAISKHLLGLHVHY